MNINKNMETEKILGSLDGCKRAVVPDFFYTRLKARMEKGLHEEESRSWILRPVYGLAGLAFLLIVNAIVILQKDETNNSNSSDNEIVQPIAGEYSLNDNTIYDLNPEK